MISVNLLTESCDYLDLLRILAVVYSVHNCPPRGNNSYSYVIEIMTPKHVPRSLIKVKRFANIIRNSD